MSRKLIIDFCDQCLHFDNHYCSYNKECKLLKRKMIQTENWTEVNLYAIPEDCPLEST